MVAVFLGEKDILALLLQLLRQILGSNVEVVDAVVANRHDDYLVLLVTLRSPALAVVVKLAGPRAPYPYPFDRTAMFYRLVATSTSIPMPDVLAVDVSYKTWPWRYLIKTYIPGRQWADVQSQMDAREMQDAYRQIGQAVAELHTIPFADFGEVDIDGCVQSKGGYLAVLAERARQRITHPHLADLFLRVVDDHTELFSDISNPCLCHEDLHKFNILFQLVDGRWRLATILDFDKAWAGHHESDLARLELWKGMVGEGFWSAYKAYCPIADAYIQRRLIYQLFWCLEYAKPSPEHIADTQHICQLLGIPPLTHFE
ncbi:MAG: phosphotransferase family protein [Ktedonobacteraceae bacterium]